MNVQPRVAKLHLGKIITSLALVVSLVAVGGGVTRVGAAGCTTPLSTNVSTRREVLNTAYTQWKSAYVTSSGAGGNGALRVQRSAMDNYDTVSEGVAYGMLFSAYMNDKPTFDGLWAYSQKYLNSNGVMHWRISANGTVTGQNGATDADADIAAALIAADTRWGGYRTAATKQIAVVKRHQIEANTNVVKPGDMWGGSAIVNPSYLAPSYYDVFQTYTGDTSWASVKAKSYEILKLAQNSTTGLVPDWSTSTGAKVQNMSYDYSYDASRAPVRLALSAAWSCDTEAAQLLAPFNQWFSSKDLTSLASSYSLNGTANGKGDALPALSAVASAATASDNTAYRTNAWNALASAKTTTYYPDSMRVFGLLVASGTMVSPLELGDTTNARPSGELRITGTSSTSHVGIANTTGLSFSAPRQTTGLIVDIEVYDTNGRKVAQQVYENQTLGTVPRTYELSWTPLAEGNYTIKGGIFTAGWAQNMLWNDNAATVQVTAAGLPQQPTPVTPVVPAPSPTPVMPSPQTQSISVWWPVSTQSISGTQPLKAVVNDASLSSYEMYWQVDGGRLNAMDSINDNAPHKEAWVDVSNWRWSSNGSYTLTFVAKNASRVTIAEKAVSMRVV